MVLTSIRGLHICVILVVERVVRIETQLGIDCRQGAVSREGALQGLEKSARRGKDTPAEASFEAEQSTFLQQPFLKVRYKKLGFNGELCCHERYSAPRVNGTSHF